MAKRQANGNIVLVGVLKSKRDRAILLRKNWYRIPDAFMPKRSFDWIAFYQPSLFGKRGKRIEYYGRVEKMEKVKRIGLLPEEPAHSRANDDYLKFEFSKILKLRHPVKNIMPRRISFGFTNITKLISSSNILELYGVPQTEEIIKKKLDSLGIPAKREHCVSAGKKRCRIDFAVFCDKGAIAIECDNRKAHSGKAQTRKDKSKDILLKRLGWKVLRFKEKDIVERPDYCTLKVERLVKRLGGLKSDASSGFTAKHEFGPVSSGEN